MNQNAKVFGYTNMTSLPTIAEKQSKNAVRDVEKKSSSSSIMDLPIITTT